MQAGWFGKVYPSGLLLPDWMKSIAMTATAIIYTPFGFAVAADGFQRWENLASRDDFIRQSETDAAQKIFEFSDAEVSLAYLTRGHVANKDRSFDIGAALGEALHTSRGTASVDPYTFLQPIALSLERYICAAKIDGRIEEYPETYIDMFGYINHVEFWTELQFFRFPNSHNGSLHAINPRQMWPWVCLFSGSMIVRDLLLQGHPLFCHFCNFTRQSLQEAARHVNGYVEACCSEVARQFDPECKEFGGHIHVATVDPRCGFRWFKPPVNVRGSDGR
jgi:hypothetical protein